MSWLVGAVTVWRVFDGSAAGKRTKRCGLKRRCGRCGATSCPLQVSWAPTIRERERERERERARESKLDLRLFPGSALRCAIPRLFASACFADGICSCVLQRTRMGLKSEFGLARRAGERRFVPLRAACPESSREGAGSRGGRKGAEWVRCEG